MSITEWLRKPRAERRAAIAAFREADKALQVYRPQHRQNRSAA